MLYYQTRQATYVKLFQQVKQLQPGDLPDEPAIVSAIRQEFQKSLDIEDVSSITCSVYFEGMKLMSNLQ